MNAYELANKAEDLKTGEYGYVDGWMDEAADMLRQQEDLLQQHEKHNLELQEIIKNQKDRIAELEKTIQDGIQAFGKVQDQMLDSKFAFPRWSKEKEMFDSWVSHEKQSVEPVAWIKKDTLIFLGNYEFGSITIQVQKQKDDEFDIPLYTTPQIKELSDEEIKPLLDRIQNYLECGGLFNPECMEHDKVKDLIMDCRAILKKASEK